MECLRFSFVDVYVLRGATDSLEVLLLRRARGQVRPGSWECVHGRIDSGETPVECARRELREEIGCEPVALYNLSRVEHFYLHSQNELAMGPVFVALVAADAVIHLSEEHDTQLWLHPDAAAAQFSWPRAGRAIEDAVRLFGSGSAGLLEDVLRVS